MSATHLTVKWTISKARDTMGYNVVTLRDDRNPKQKYQAMGGGYDMVGTVFAQWLQETYEDRLVAIAERAHQELRGSKSTEPFERTKNDDGLYGFTMRYVHYSNGELAHSRPMLDGACGLRSMETIAEAIGLQVKQTFGGRSHDTTGFIIEGPEPTVYDNSVFQ